MLDDFWVIKSHGTWYRVTEAIAMECLNFIEEIRKAAVRDMTLVPTFFRFVDLTGGIVFVDIKTISAITESTHEIRGADKEQADWLNLKEFPGF